MGGVGGKPESVGVATAGYRLMSTRLMIALEFGLVQLVEDGRRVVGIPDSNVLLGGRVEAAVRKCGHGGFGNRRLEALELRGGEDGTM